VEKVGLQHTKKRICSKQSGGQGKSDGGNSCLAGEGAESKDHRRSRVKIGKQEVGVWR